LVIGDAGFPKKGTESAGVARQYSGTLLGPTGPSGRSPWNCSVGSGGRLMDR